MPATSKSQFRAMQAAAHGHSTLGIPAKVGKDFVAATPSSKGLPEKKGKQSNDEFHMGPAKPARTPVANPQRTNQAVHETESKRHAKSLHARVKAGLKKAFTPSKTGKTSSDFHPTQKEHY